MNITSKSVLIFPLLAALSGCIGAEERAVVVDITALSPAPEGSTDEMARLIIHRNRNFEGLLGGAFRPPVTLDGQVVGECAKREMLVVDLAPGIHRVSTRSESSNERVFDIAAGETAYVVCNYTLGLVVPNINLVFETAEEGEGIIAGMRVQ